MEQHNNINWLIKMAWRDSRRNRMRLLLFISSIVIGIAALVAINSFSENLQKDINMESKTLIGADLLLEENKPIPDSIFQLLDTLNPETSRATNFASMAFFPRTGDTRLSYIRAMEGAYPFYGNIMTEPAGIGKTFHEEKKALVDKTMMIQFDLKPGDSVKVGQVTFEIAGQVNSTPGRAGIASSVAPLVMIPMRYLDETGLVQMGSRVEYQYFYKYPEGMDVDKFIKPHRKTMRNQRIDFETVEMRKENIGEAFADMATFLNLVGFIALLLGCIGVASAVHIYIKDKLATVAVLRCLGASGRQAFYIYLIQILVIGVIGAVLGALLGSLIQIFLPLVLQDFLPLENVSTSVSSTAVAQGIFTGLGISILFALLPLLSIRTISPLRTLRASYEDSESSQRDPMRWLVYALIVLFVTGFTLFQTGFSIQSLFFPIGIVVAFLLLAGTAQLAMWLLKKFFPTKWSYVWRQSIANLYRPNNQTLILIVSIGLGTFLISTLFFTQDLLLEQVEMTGSGKQPNMILYDIQSSQKEGVAAIVSKNELPLIQQVPIVTMRLDELDGITKEQFLKDNNFDKDSLRREERPSSSGEKNRVSRWVYNREYRNTYRDTLIDTETIVEGVWHGDKPDDGNIYISLAEHVVDNFNAKIGTKLTFNVQGRQIETIVSSIRKVDFNRVQTNFMVVFPTGVLEKAPQFHVIISRADTPEKSAIFQREIVQAFPNVSVIDLTQILETIDNVLTKVSFVIRFMALFSILTGLLVLISSVVLSKYQRIKESVLLRTLGASRSQILWINALEYFLLGALAAVTGIGLSLIATWLLATFSFGLTYTPNLLPALVVFVVITSLTILIGMFNSRDVLNKPPLEVLRKEV